MKKKFKPDNQIRFCAQPFYAALILFGLGFGVWAIYYLSYVDFSLGYLIAYIAVVVGDCWFAQRVYHEFWELFWASITISETEIVWSCPLRPTHVIQVDDCIIGMENEISGWNMTYPHIYFSMQPYPREFSNKIQKIPNSDNFIKFRYRADLADYLVEHLPKQKTFQVAYYRECEKREAKKRRRKKRK